MNLKTEKSISTRGENLVKGLLCVVLSLAVVLCVWSGMSTFGSDSVKAETASFNINVKYDDSQDVMNTISQNFAISIQEVDGVDTTLVFYNIFDSGVVAGTTKNVTLKLGSKYRLTVDTPENMQTIIAFNNGLSNSYKTKSLTFVANSSSPNIYIRSQTMSLGQFDEQIIF